MDSKHQFIRLHKHLSVDIRATKGESVDSQVPPEANSILKIFGAWLFDAAVNDTPMFEMGRAQALGALSRIFCDRTNRRYVCYWFNCS